MVPSGSHRSLTALLALVAAGVLMFPSGASAHAKYESSSPADESTVPSPPSEVWAEYSEPPTQESWLQVYDPCGVRVDSGTYSYFGKRITTSMSADKAGTYTVLWRVVSDLDSHPTSGEFTFTVGDGAACPGSEEDPGDEREQGDGGTRVKGKQQASTEEAGSPDGGTEEPADVASGGTVSAKRKADHKPQHRGQRKQGGERDRDRSDRVIDLATSDTPAEQPAEDDIPTGWLLISFGIAALIGAAGGQIYVNLIGDD